MKTVTTGRDAQEQPIWHPALLQLAAEFDGRTTQAVAGPSAPVLAGPARQASRRPWPEHIAVVNGGVRQDWEVSGTAQAVLVGGWSSSRVMPSGSMK
jgi:hypothetical protein